MQMGRVIGNIISVSKVDEIRSLKLYIVRILSSDFKPLDKFVIAVDAIGVSFNDYVLISKGSASRMTKVTKDMPVDASIIARIDE